MRRAGWKIRILPANGLLAFIKLFELKLANAILNELGYMDKDIFITRQNARHKHKNPPMNTLHRPRDLLDNRSLFCDLCSLI